MKNKNMKKALSLFLAVLMIALAMPFTLLTAVAQDAVNNTLSIESVELKGYFKDTAGRTGYLADNTSGLNKLYNGDIACGGGGDDEVLTWCSKEANSATSYKTSRFVDGVYTCSETEDYDDGYYGVLVIKLSDVSNVDTFNLWCDSTYADKWPDWVSNEAYDIWYSLDGETYYTNDALKFTDAVSAYEDGVYVKKDGTEQSGVVHAVELGGVMAQYIAIAVTKFAPGTTQNEMVFHEVSAEGNVVDIPVSVDGLQLNKFDSSKVRLVGTVSNTKVKEVGFKVDMTWATSMSENSKFAAIKSVKYDGWFATEEGTSKEVVLADGHKNDKIIDGTTNPGYTDGEADAADESYTGGVAGTLKKTSHFVDGVYSYSKTENYSDGYYGVLFLNLDALSEIDTLNLWCDSIYAEQYPGWVSNSDYDIWYSVDGVTYETSDSLKFSDVADKNGPDSDFYKNGTFVEKDGTERNTVVHSIEMQGVYAKYIAIAVRGIAPGSSVNELVFHEITVDGKALDNKTASITEGTNTVYTSILADGETYSVDGAFIYALALDGIPSNGIFEIEVTPYFIPKGYDAKVYGETVSFKFIDGEIVRN